MSHNVLVKLLLILIPPHHVYSNLFLKRCSISSNLYRWWSSIAALIIVGHIGLTQIRNRALIDCGEKKNQFFTWPHLQY